MEKKKKVIEIIIVKKTTKVLPTKKGGKRPTTRELCTHPENNFSSNEKSCFNFFS